ncbi:hypothetical protein [Streptomyces abyssomicinicus]|uniref:hypothetical protein n=1 Tax=Streptomyces abyssomicinicus TaxID=574929 RepID=UPI00124FEAFB|nr:hypothetical protein [Streptomyces abyssomicinicus]
MTTASLPDDDGDSPEDQSDAHDEIFRAADAVNASLAGVMEPQREMLRILREASLAPAMDVSRFVREALGPHQAWQNTMREIFAEQHRAVFAPMNSVLEQILADQQERYASIARMTRDGVPQLDTTFLDAVLRDTTPWQGLSDPMRSVFADVLDGARVAVESGEEPDVPEEMVTELEERAVQFAASTPGPIPASVQKYMFAVFVAATVWTALMYLSISSDTANAVIDEATQHGELAVLVFTAACLAWDRKQGNDRNSNE